MSSPVDTVPALTADQAPGVRGALLRYRIMAYIVGTLLVVLVVVGMPLKYFGDNGIVAFTGAGTLPIGSTILALSAHPSLRRPKSVQPLLFLQVALVLAVAALAFVGMLVPKLVPGVPSPNSPGALALLAAGLLFYAVLGWRAQKEQAHYAAAKAGVMAFTRCAAVEAAEFGVRINAVAPSIALHDFLKKASSEELLAQLASREAFGRAAEVWEVANVMVFLASDYASYMTGEIVSVSSQHA